MTTRFGAIDAAGLAVIAAAFFAVVRAVGLRAQAGGADVGPAGAR